MDNVYAAPAAAIGAGGLAAIAPRFSIASGARLAVRSYYVGGVYATRDYIACCGRSAVLGTPAAAFGLTGLLVGYLVRRHRPKPVAVDRADLPAELSDQLQVDRLEPAFVRIIRRDAVPTLDISNRVSLTAPVPEGVVAIRPPLFGMKRARAKLEALGWRCA